MAKESCAIILPQFIAVCVIGLSFLDENASLIALIITLFQCIPVIDNSLANYELSVFRNRYEIYQLAPWRKCFLDCIIAKSQKIMNFKEIHRFLRADKLIVITARELATRKHFRPVSWSSQWRVQRCLSFWVDSCQTSSLLMMRGGAHRPSIVPHGRHSSPIQSPLCIIIRRTQQNISI